MTPPLAWILAALVACTGGEPLKDDTGADADSDTDTDSDSDTDGDSDTGAAPQLVWELPGATPPTEVSAIWIARLTSEGAEEIPSATVIGPDGSFSERTEMGADYVVSASLVVVSVPDACSALTAMQDALNEAFLLRLAGDLAGAAAVMAAADATANPEDYWQLSVGFAAFDPALLGEQWTLGVTQGVSAGNGEVFHHREEIDWVAAAYGATVDNADVWSMESGALEISGFDPDAGTMTVSGSVTLEPVTASAGGTVALALDAERCPSLEDSLAVLGMW